MLTDDEIEALAGEHVKRTYPADCEILRTEKRSSPDGVYFVANRNTDGYIGPGGFFVDRVSGEIWSFSSGQIWHEGLEYWLKWYAEGWRPGWYRLTVRDVTDPHRFAKVLVEHRVTYLVRELEHGVVWKTRVGYDEDTAFRRIETLPCTFVMSADQLRLILTALRKVAGFDYGYIDIPRKYDWRPENNTPDLLGPQWDEPG